MNNQSKNFIKLNKGDLGPYDPTGRKQVIIRIGLYKRIDKVKKKLKTMQFTFGQTGESQPEKKLVSLKNLVQ